MSIYHNLVCLHEFSCVPMSFYAYRCKHHLSWVWLFMHVLYFPSRLNFAEGVFRPIRAYTYMVATSVSGMCTDKYECTLSCSML